MSAKGAITMVLATEYVSAFDKDAATPASERTGRIGRNVSDWIRGVADGICESDAELAKLRAECEGLLADAMRIDWFQTLTPHKLARIRAQFMPDKSGDIRAAIDAAMGRGESA